MLPPCVNKLLSSILLFLFLFTPQSFARDDRDRKGPMDQFASLLSDTLKASSCNEKASQSSKQSSKTSPPSAMKQKQNQQKRERLFEKSAQKAEKLIKKYEIDVNQEVMLTNRTHPTFPVVVAAETGNVPMMKMLIKHGADLNQRINDEQVYMAKKQPFYFSQPRYLAIIVAKTGNVPMMEMLIKHGANLDQKMEKSHIMPKHYSAVLAAAAESGHIPMVELLLKHIPDTDYQRLGTTYIAARKGDLPMLRFLKEQGIPFYSGCLGGISHECNVTQSCRSKQGTDCIHLTVMKYLLENGFDIKKDRGEALAWACLKGNEPMVRFLLEHGAECDIHTAAICSATGSAIVKAGEGGNVNIIKMLLAKGANIHDVRQDGKANALHEASQYGQTTVVPFLVQQGIEVNTPNGYGETPLILAAKFGRLDTVKVLLAQGADASVKDHKGKTAAEHALELSNHTGKTTKHNGREYVNLGEYFADKKDAKEIYRLLNKTR